MKELVVDLSHWDSGFNISEWVSKRDLWGVILKAGGNESNFGRYKDNQFEQFYADAKKVGVHIGAYYYTVSTTVADAKLDAAHFVNLLSNKKFDMPVYIDVEDPRQMQLSRRTLTDVIKAFIEVVNTKGYYGGLYTGGSAWLNNMYPEELGSYANWIAWWHRNWPSEAGDIGMWQQGGIRLSDGNIVFDDISGYHDCNWCVIDYPSRINKGQTIQSESSAIEEANMTTVRDRILSKARGELGVRYYSMHTGPRGSAVEGWGCAMFYAWCLNRILGTKYYGSCYNFAGDALGQSVNQGGNEFEFITEAQAKPGDAVIYSPSGYTGTDYDDYGHIAMYIGNGRVIGAMGRGVPGANNYINIGISDTPISTQSLGGKHRFIRCKRVDATQAKIDAKKQEDKAAEIRPVIHGYSAKLYHSNNTPMQQFKMEYAGNGYMYIRNVGRNMLLDVKDGGKADKTPVRIWEPNLSDAQQWKLIPCSGDYQGRYELEPKCAPGMRLDAVSGGTKDKTGIWLHPDNDTAAQRWYIIDSQDGIFRLSNAKSGLCIDCGDGVQ